MLGWDGGRLLIVCNVSVLTADGVAAVDWHQGVSHFARDMQRSSSSGMALSSSQLAAYYGFVDERGVRTPSALGARDRSHILNSEHTVYLLTLACFFASYAARIVYLA